MTFPPLVFVWIGENLPGWAIDSINITRNLCGLKTIILTNKSVKKCSFVDEHFYIDDFYKINSKFNNQEISVSNFRDGFWAKTLERFLVIKSFMRFAGVEKIFHAELDNIIFNIEGLSSRLDNLGTGFFCPRDSESRGIASLIYINDVSSLDCFDMVDFSGVGIDFNDMLFLGKKLQTSNQFHSLPTENSLSDFGCRWNFIQPQELGGIFDAASIGQYLFGIDTRNTFLPSFNGFINENSGSNLKKLQFNIDIDSGVNLVSVINKPLSYRLFNIHVHSKIFGLIKNDQFFDLIIKKINRGKKTLVKKNFGYGA